MCLDLIHNDFLKWRITEEVTINNKLFLWFALELCNFIWDIRNRIDIDFKKWISSFLLEIELVVYKEKNKRELEREFLIIDSRKMKTRK